MAININDVKTQVEDLARKDQNTGYITPPRFNRAAYLAQREEINYQRNQFENSSISSDSLSDLKVRESYVIPENGRLTKPSNYLYFSAAYNFFYNTDSKFLPKSIPLVTDNAVAERLSGEFRKPNKKRPIMVEYGTYFQFYPPSLTKVDLVYIKNPADPIWGYTVVSGRDVYSAGASTNFELPENLFGNIVYRICRQIGIQVQQQDLVVLGSQLINVEDKE